jgi:hypothetical protein
MQGIDSHCRLNMTGQVGVPPMDYRSDRLSTFSPRSQRPPRLICSNIELKTHNLRLLRTLRPHPHLINITVPFPESFSPCFVVKLICQIYAPCGSSLPLYVPSQPIKASRV